MFESEVLSTGFAFQKKIFVVHIYVLKKIIWGLMILVCKQALSTYNLVTALDSIENRDGALMFFCLSILL